MKRIAPFVLAGLVGTVLCATIVTQCSPSPEEKEEAAQIEEIEYLCSRPTYYVDDISGTESVYKVLLHRESSKADGTLPEKLTVAFYEEYTPSVAYLKKMTASKLIFMPSLTKNA